MCVTEDVKRTLWGMILRHNTPENLWNTLKPPDTPPNISVTSLKVQEMPLKPPLYPRDLLKSSEARGNADKMSLRPLEKIPWKPSEKPPWDPTKCMWKPPEILLTSWALWNDPEWTLKPIWNHLKCPCNYHKPLSESFWKFPETPRDPVSGLDDLKTSWDN